ncbi:hypothetical protein [Sphingomonas trueperi]|uniref:hypothetical protein n=1 Tax=Sphingomonas trueperi TaxID=53317 RepID=UPI000EB14075
MLPFIGFPGVASSPAFAASSLPAAPPTGADGNHFRDPYRDYPGDLQAPSAPGSAPRLPSAPPVPGAHLWDPGNRHKTLIALGTGLLSGNSLADGIGRAGANALGLEEQLKAERRAQLPQRQYGGPDDAFEIVTNPSTGEHTVRSVQQFMDYATAKRTKAKDTADLNGRAMAALQQLPEADRPAAYAMMLQHPDQYGIDAEHMPAAYDRQYADMTSRMGMTVAQAQAIERKAAEDAARAEARKRADEDRAARTRALVSRSAALTAQGQQRIGIAAAKAKTGGPHKAAGAHPDLTYVLN